MSSAQKQPLAARIAAAIERIWRSDSPRAGVARAALAPLSLLFRGVVALRRRLYDSGFFPSYSVDVPVVSIGNLTVGGTGKTPLVLWLVEQLLRRGVRPAVVSRGYGASADSPSVLVTSSAQRSGAVAAAGDEAALVARRTGCPVVACTDRVRACQIAAERFGPDVILLDDGFQHWRLKRDMDLIVLGGEEWTRSTLPAGPLREGPKAMDRADFILDGSSAGVPEGFVPDAAERLLRMERRSLALVETVAPGARKRPLEQLEGRRVVAVAGIARPERFFAAVQAAGAEILETMVFRDHHRYRDADWLRIVGAAARADCVVTTEKDLVKLVHFEPEPGFLVALRQSVTVPGGDRIVERICELDAKPRRGNHPPAPPVGVSE